MTGPHPGAPNLTLICTNTVPALDSCSIMYSTSLIHALAALLLALLQDTLTVTVSLVRLGVTVADSRGRNVTGLKNQDFRLSVNGVPREIAFFSDGPQPISLGIVLDQSFSMSYDNKLERAKEAAHTLVHAVHDGSEYFYVTFDDEVRIVRSVTSDRSDIDFAIDATALGRGTSLFDAVIQGIDLSRKTMRHRQVLVVISDGADTHSKEKLATLMKAARESEVQIYTIGYFNPEEDQLFRTNGAEIKMTARTVHNPRVVLTELSEQSGGKAFFPKTDTAMTAAVQAIVNDLRSQYTIEFYRQPTDNDTYQELRLLIQGHRGAIRTRSGFGGRQ